MVDPLTNGIKPESGSRWREHCTHVWVTARWAVVSTIATGYEPVDLMADLLPISADGAKASALSRRRRRSQSGRLLADCVVRRQ